MFQRTMFTRLASASLFAAVLLLVTLGIPVSGQEEGQRQIDQ